MKQHTASFLLLTLAGCASTGSIADRTEYRYSSEKSAKSLADCYYLLGEDKAGTGMFLERVDLSESLGEYRVHLYYDRDGYKIHHWMYRLIETENGTDVWSFGKELAFNNHKAELESCR